ncbi:MAG: DUF58 domain-containing protein [Undibacterium sp.]|nr:DUF58 domain-containing protein [Opitutaceae bacterium]
MKTPERSTLEVRRSEFDVRPGPAAGWSGPGAKRRRRKFRWSELVWALVWPRGGERIVPTVSGVILIALCFGLGTAAYNSSSNILFITLSLLLACLILSGVLSWLNLRGVAWRLEVKPPLRTGQVASAGLALRNGKKFLPTYGLWFEWVARPMADPMAGAKAESTVTGKGIDVRAILKKAEAEAVRGNVTLRERLEAQGEVQLDWSFAPARRGRLRVELAGVGSLFPFGFLRKYVGTELRADVIVWPAAVEYRRLAVNGARRIGGSEQRTRVGSGGDLLALRRYADGDSHRLIHWKASARTQQLLVRQFMAESSQGYAVWLRTDAELWPRAEQFEMLVSFAATLVEDLFRAGQLHSLALDGEPAVAVRHGRDLETWLDRLAVVEFKAATADGERGGGTAPTGGGGRNMLVFAPDGTHGAAAYIDGQRAAVT